MNAKKKQPILLTHIQENNQTYEYLGPDGRSIDESYNLYLEKCSEFVAKARKYKRDNLNIKNSLLPENKYGFENSEAFEEEVLKDREEKTENYRKMFDITCFHEDPNFMYENFKGQSKRIRIVRDVKGPEPPIEFTDNFDKETNSWFTRYCTLSRFIQAARIIIVLNRLKKNLNVLKVLMPKDIEKFEADKTEVKEELEENNIVRPKILPCNYCPPCN